jgi:hypothetical protein
MEEQMSDETTPEGGNNSGETPAADEFQPITSQEDLNRIIGERVKRAKPADYDDLRAKAARLDEIEEANKTEQQKLADRLAEAEKSAQQAQTEALRFKIASKFGVSDEDADLFLTGTDEDTLTKQAERLAARNEEAGKPRAPKPDPNQGRVSSGTSSTADQFAAAIESQFTR